MDQTTTIKELERVCEVKSTYHSDMMCQNYDVKIIGRIEANGRITLNPSDKSSNVFTFIHSDPDRVIAIANMMKSFAELVKKHTRQNAIDNDEDV